ncbi:MAG TPA: SDR family oxidoreductase [Kiritimatiellia bacterium]|nr:SDR family oxidoreductase [Kiritimatiellia bacterium]HMP34403.1 SDR family oxidoreductase [Kiritimatiellia bacterium]
MSSQFDGKKALVMSGTKGIGRGVAEALAGEGAEVWLTSSNMENIDAACAAMSVKYGRQVHGAVLHADQPEGAAETARCLLKDSGGFDVLIVNGPGPVPSNALGMSSGQLQAALNRVVFTALEVCNVIVPVMQQRGYGRIVFLASTTAREPDGGMTTSNMTRAALLAYAKTLSREVARQGVTVNTVLTGGVLSDRTEYLLRRDAEASGKTYGELLQGAHEAFPVGHIATPEEFARAVVFLASPAASFVTGISMPVDGGLMRAM